MKIRKYYTAGTITYPGLLSLSLKTEKPVVKPGNQVAALGAGLATDYLSGLLSNNLFGNSELGRQLGTIFSLGVSSAGNTMTNNLLKGQTLTEGLAKDAGQSLAGAGVGLASNYIGQGINSLGGDTMLSRGIGQGVATGLGMVGGLAVSNLFKYGSIVNKAKGATEATSLIGKGAGAINPYALGMTVAGTALGAALGPSKEYGGKYGGMVRTADTVYDAITVGVNAIPGYGQIISGALALNKGLGNVFGSTDGMTLLDSILGTAFMPAPVKWLNMAGAKTTDTFKGLSWLNLEKVNNFMGNAFGNLGDRFNDARELSGKTYGTFSLGAYNEAQSNITFANNAWKTILGMADLNRILNIRSWDMTSINNLKYAQNIQGGWNQTARGKYGMKILNNATNHNIGMRLLSGAALIDNKQMILCSAVD